VLSENLQNLLGIQRIILAAAGLKGLAELGDGLGVERIDDQEVVAEQGVNQSSAGLFHRHGHGPAVETFAKLGNPRSDELGLLLQFSGFLSLLACGLKAEGVFLIGPIDTDKGREVWL